MLTATDPTAAIDYSRSILAATAAMLDHYDARLPLPPDSGVWAGRARSQYGVQLGELREYVARLRAHLDSTREQLSLAGSRG